MRMQDWGRDRNVLFLKEKYMWPGITVHASITIPKKENCTVHLPMNLEQAGHLVWVAIIHYIMIVPGIVIVGFPFTPMELFCI